MKKKLRIILSILLLAVFLGSSLMLIHRGADYAEGDSTYDAAEELAGLQGLEEIPEPLLPLESLPGQPAEPVEVEPPVESPVPEEPQGWREAPVHGDPYMDTLQETDLAALRAVNPDVLGWIVIPDTKLNYPIMGGEDNDYYLNNTWDKKPSSVGSIFLESQNSEDLSDFNTIIYGHRMKDGSMFASLKYYNDQEHWRQHPYVYIVDDSGVHRYEIFAAYEAGITTYTYCLGFTEELKVEFLDSCMRRSVIDTGVAPAVSDRILTLSTCTGKGYESRWVVQARLAAADDLQMQ